MPMRARSSRGTSGRVNPEGKPGDRRAEGRAIRADEFEVALHVTRGATQNAEALVLVDSAGLQHWLLAHDSLALDLLIPGRGIVDEPVTPAESSGCRTLVLDADVISENEVLVRRLRLISQEEGLGTDPDAFGDLV
jgi:hypothetical protein